MNTSMDSSPYGREPVAVRNGIPIFCEPDAVSANYDRIARDHLTAMAKGHGNPFFRESVWTDIERVTVAALRRHVKPGDRVLDVGVGLGRTVTQIADIRRYGADISFDYLENARGKNIEVCVARAEDLPYRDAYFDVVVCTDVLEHVIDLNAAVAGMYRVLKPGGELILRVPDREDLSPYLDPDYPYEYAHLRNFDPAGLRLLLCKSFRFEFDEYDPVYAHTHLKFRLPLPTPVRRLVAGALYLATFKAASLRRAVARIFYRPFEISMVVRKPGNDTPPTDGGAGKMQEAVPA